MVPTPLPNARGCPTSRVDPTQWNWHLQRAFVAGPGRTPADGFAGRAGYDSVHDGRRPPRRVRGDDQAIITDFRANGGQVTSGPFAGRPVLLLTTTGAQSGQPRLAPVVYSRDGDRYVILASKGGSPTHPAWYHNLVAKPVVTVEVGGETFEATARVTEGMERDRLFAQRAATNPNFAEYQKKTTRVIPVVVLERLG